MVNEVVKYHNDLNSVSFRSWSAEEMNLFFTVIAKIRDNGIETIILETNELKEPEIARIYDEAIMIEPYLTKK